MDGGIFQVWSGDYLWKMGDVSVNEDSSSSSRATTGDRGAVGEVAMEIWNFEIGFVREMSFV